MNAVVAGALVEELRHVVATTIASEKAYDVPQVCASLGLASGDESEARNSKQRYAKRRLAELALPDLASVARKLSSRTDSFRLREAITKVDEASQPEVTDLTRSRLVSVFDSIPLCTIGEEIDLIRQVWPINRLPSLYSPQDSTLSFEDDFVRHTIANYDWSNRDLLGALGFAHCSLSLLFRFLSKVTDPRVQVPERQAEIVARLNEHLAHDGYALVEVRRSSGSPYYEVRHTGVGSPSDASISETLAAFGPNDIHGRWAAALTRRAAEPAGAITLARTLLEDVCKWILNEAGQSWKETDDLPVLYRALAKILRLAPDDHAEQVFKQILGSCQSIVESLGAMRNKLGDAHGQGPLKAKPAVRHAELAVNLAGAMATFLVATWQARKEEAARSGA